MYTTSVEGIWSNASLVLCRYSYSFPSTPFLYHNQTSLHQNTPSLLSIYRYHYFPVLERALRDGEKSPQWFFRSLSLEIGDLTRRISTLGVKRSSDPFEGGSEKEEAWEVGKKNLEAAMLQRTCSHAIPCLGFWAENEATLISQALRPLLPALWTMVIHFFPYILPELKSKLHGRQFQT